MSDNLRRIVLPTIYDYFSKPCKKRALQYVAWWGNLKELRVTKHAVPESTSLRNQFRAISKEAREGRLQDTTSF